VACFRSGLAALCLALLGPAWRARPDRRALLVAVPYAAVMVLYVAASKLTTAANTIVLQSTALVWVMLLAPLLLREPTRRSDWGLGVLAAAGLGLLVLTAEPAQPTAPDPARGDWLAAGAGLAWGLTLLGLRWLARSGRGAEGAVVAGNLLACGLCLPFALPVAPGGVAPLDAAVVVWLGVFQVGLAYGCLTRGVRGVPASGTALLLLAEPVLNALFAWLLHGETPPPTSLAGAVLVLGAVLARTLRDARSGWR
jgi:DME family drug/metabolite transporter